MSAAAADVADAAAAARTAACALGFALEKARLPRGAGGRGRGPPSRLGRVDWVADEGGFARRQERRTRIEHTFATLAHIEDPLTVRIDPKTTAMPLCLCDNGDDIAQSFTAVRRGA